MPSAVSGEISPTETDRESIPSPRRPTSKAAALLLVVVLVLSAALVTLGLLTIVKAPASIPWQLAVLATQYGHWLSPGILLAAVIAWRRSMRSPARRRWQGAALLFTMAANLLFVPAARAWIAAKTLPGAVRETLLSAESQPSSLPWFSVRRLYFGREPERAKVETHVFAQGAGYELSLTAYLPTRSDDTNRLRPAIVLVHGGGWDGGTRDELADFNHWLVSIGAVVFAIDYRLAPRWTWPAPRDDVRAALAWVREHSARFGVDPGRVVLFGRSAGAQLALAVAYDAASPPVRGVIAFYGPADMQFAYQYGREDDVLKSPGLLRAYLGGAPEEQPRAYHEASPYLHVRREVPPTLLVHGEIDTLVWHRQSERLAARLREAGVPHFFLSVPSATHALEYNQNSPGGQLACGAVKAFLASVAAGQAPR